MYSGSGTTSDTNSTMVFHAVENIRDVISRIVWSEDEKKGAVWNDHLVEKGGGSQQYQNSPAINRGKNFQMRQSRGR